MTNEEMFNKNIKIAYKIANTYLINYKNEYEDIKQVALEALWKAILTFKDTHKFSTYAYAVISNEINLYVRKEKRNKNNISMSEEIAENTRIEDIIKDENDFEERIVKTEETKEMQKILRNEFLNLEQREQKVCMLMLKNKKQKEMAKELNISQSTASRLERKIKKYFGGKIENENI